MIKIKNQNYWEAVFPKEYSLQKCYEKALKTPCRLLPGVTCFNCQNDDVDVEDGQWTCRVCKARGFIKLLLANAKDPEGMVSKTESFLYKDHAYRIFVTKDNVEQSAQSEGDNLNTASNVASIRGPGYDAAKVDFWKEEAQKAFKERDELKHKLRYDAAKVDFWKEEAQKAFKERDELKHKLREAAPLVATEEWRKQFHRDIERNPAANFEYDEFLGILSQAESENKLIDRIDVSAYVLREMRQWGSCVFQEATTSETLKRGIVGQVLYTYIYLNNDLGMKMRTYFRPISKPDEYEFPVQPSISLQEQSGGDKVKHSPIVDLGNIDSKMEPLFEVVRKEVNAKISEMPDPPVLINLSQLTKIPDRSMLYWNKKYQSMCICVDAAQQRFQWYGHAVLPTKVDGCDLVKPKEVFPAEWTKICIYPEYKIEEIESIADKVTFVSTSSRLIDALVKEVKYLAPFAFRPIRCIPAHRPEHLKYGYVIVMDVLVKRQEGNPKDTKEMPPACAYVVGESGGVPNTNGCPSPATGVENGKAIAPSRGQSGGDQSDKRTWWSVGDYLRQPTFGGMYGGGEIQCVLTNIGKSASGQCLVVAITTTQSAYFEAGRTISDPVAVADRDRITPEEFSKITGGYKF